MYHPEHSDSRSHFLDGHGAEGIYLLLETESGISLEWCWILSRLSCWALMWGWSSASKSGKFSTLACFSSPWSVQSSWLQQFRCSVGKCHCINLTAQKTLNYNFKMINVYIFPNSEGESKPRKKFQLMSDVYFGKWKSFLTSISWFTSNYLLTLRRNHFLTGVKKLFPLCLF
jgi:hypothetical protein